MSLRLIGLSSHFVTILLSPYLFYFIIITYSFSFLSLSLSTSSYLFSSLGWWFFTSQRKKGSHITLFIPSFDIDSEILVWEAISGDRVHVFISDLRYLSPIGVWFIDDKKKNKKKKTQWYAHILFYWAFMPPFEVHLLGIFVIVGFCEFFYEFFTPWATLVMHLECRGFIWEFYEILCFLDHVWYILGMRDE